MPALRRLALALATTALALTLAPCQPQAPVPPLPQVQPKVVPPKQYKCARWRARYCQLEFKVREA